MLKIALTSLALTLISLSTFAGGKKVVLATSELGKAWTLTFPTAEVTMDTDQVVFCGEPHATVTLAELWMPDCAHPHGSDPTDIRPVDESDCTPIHNLYFVMPGRWLLRTSTISSGTADKGVFEFMVTDEQRIEL